MILYLTCQNCGKRSEGKKVSIPPNLSKSGYTSRVWTHMREYALELGWSIVNDVVFYCEECSK